MDLKNVWNLGTKELRGLARDWIMLILIASSFSLSVWTSANSRPDALSKAAISIVDEDQSLLSSRITSAFYPPYFVLPNLITAAEVDRRMDAGLDTFALDIPPDFERDVLAGKSPEIQLSIDATRMSQAFTGGGYVSRIVSSEVSAGTTVTPAPAFTRLRKMLSFAPKSMATTCGRLSCGDRP